MGRVDLVIAFRGTDSFAYVVKCDYIRSRPPTAVNFRLSRATVTHALSHPPPLSEPLLRGEGVVSLASVRAQSVDLRRLFEIPACPTAAIRPFVVHICMECMAKSVILICGV